MKTTIPLTVTFVTGVILVLEYFIPAWPIRGPAHEFQEWGPVVMSAMVILGTVNIVTVNLPKIRRKEANWGYKILMLVSLLVTCIVGFGFGPFDSVGTLAYALYDYVFRPLQATMFALLAFFIASAAFRAFRARSVEASLLLGAAIIVMLGRVPIGEFIHSSLPDFVDWINNVPNLAAKRAILMGAAVGAISTGIRVILGLERSYLSG